jgi:acyl-CoA synthetase (AMP-forming)/AMP-acid ligase II/3-oxoacyl-(acyl-carrier-protein) synthase/acyl carrier protein
MDPYKGTTLGQMLAVRAQRQPEQIAYRHLDASGAISAVNTYAELDTRARGIAAALRSFKARGERAILLYPSGLEVIAALFGCFYEGVIAVPAAIPRSGSIRALANIIHDAQARFILSDKRVHQQLKRMEEAREAISSAHWIFTEDMNEGGEWDEPILPSGSLSYLQYTSGSTSSPRAAMISHANALANCAHIASTAPADNDSLTVSWLPHFHDMGLLFGILEPLFSGKPSVFMPPTAALQSPMVWLQAMTQFRASHTCAPNFAYELCVDRISSSQCDLLDLGPLRLAGCGAEPIREKAVERFCAKFEPCGFRRLAFSPGYGLAESTMLVCGVPEHQPYSRKQLDADAMGQNRIVESSSAEAPVVIGCGFPDESTRVVIVRPKSRSICEAGEIGEIWVRGPSVALGYWNKAAQTREVFQARLSGVDEGPFLRTGDLGFLSNGELFVTGRLKDIVIIRGCNHYPHDIEEAVQRSHEALQVGAGAAFSVDIDDQERLVVVQEVKRSLRRTDLDKVIGAIRQQIVESLAIAPHSIVLLKPYGVPKTSSGKVQRHACRDRYLQKQLPVLKEWTEPLTAQAAVKVPAITGSLHPLREWLITRVAQAKRLDPALVDSTQSFSYYGFDSRDAVMFAAELEKSSGLQFPATLLYDHPSIDALSQYLEKQVGPSTSFSGQALAVARKGTEPVAIIGIGCRFPSADGPQQFWKLLLDGIDAVKPVPGDRSRLNAFQVPFPGGFLNGIDLFDASVFGISPLEAKRMDPQQRILLEVAWHALEDAGIVRDKVRKKKAGVFVGISNSDYGRILLADKGPKDSYTASGASLSIASNRISYTFDWTGPSISIDTACSSSLVAVHLAIQSLRSGESEIALAGGVNVILSPDIYDDFSTSGMLAPDGRCKTFDSRADGYVRSEGAGLVVLKPLEQALADGDFIYCTILGSAANQDGRSNGLMAPNRGSQIELLRQAWNNASVASHEVQYIEAHGSGTLLGDTIEAGALGEAMGAREPEGRCWVGSVKTNIGHAESAAGIAGLIKAALALHHGKIPPSLHFEQPNPNIDWKKLPLRVAREATPWPSETKRIAGVSSFGFGGTNAHIVLGQAPRSPLPNTSGEEPTAQLLPISACSQPALRSLARAYEDFLALEPAVKFADICSTAATRRGHYPHRLAIAAESAKEALSRLRQKTEEVNAGMKQGPCRPVFVFSGQGAQRPGMGQQLLANEPAFQAAINECDALLRARGAPGARQLLAFDGNSPDGKNFDSAQLAIFVLQVGLAALWRSWGIVPAAVLGHSTGEIAAAYVAGAFTLADAVELIVLRSRLTKRIWGKGGMLSVKLPVSDTETVIRCFGDSVVIAAENSHSCTVVSGDLAALHTLQEQLGRNSHQTDFVKIDYASHSPHVDSLYQDFITGASRLHPSSP